MKEIIQQLTEAFGPSGYEGEVRELIQSLIEHQADEVKTDVLGNLIAVKKGRDEGKKIMLAAHMDEIGIVVTHIDEQGFLRFANVGGVGIPTLVGNRVRFQNGTIGVIYRQKGEWKEVTLDKLYLDIGAENEAEAKNKVRVGDFGIFHREFTALGDRLVAKSMDDRVGCAVLVEALRQIKNPLNTLYCVFTTQEEVGLRGARTAAYGLEPDLGIAVDVTLTGDTPEAQRMDVSLGQGAAIKVRDSSLITHPKVKKLLSELASTRGIPFQLEVLERGGTDAGAIHLSRSGIPSGAISIPTRYVHSPSEIVDLKDVQACLNLVVALADQELKEL